MKRPTPPPRIVAHALYNPNEVASLVCVHPESILRAARQNRLPVIRWGRQVRIKGSVVLSILEHGLPQVERPRPAAKGP